MRVTWVFLLSAVLCVFPTVLASENPEAPLAPSQGVAPQLEALGGAPLYFEVNQGQADETLRFLSRGPNYGLFVSERETVLALTRGALGEPRDSAAVRIRFVGASEAAVLACFWAGSAMECSQQESGLPVGDERVGDELLPLVYEELHRPSRSPTAPPPPSTSYWTRPVAREP